MEIVYSASQAVELAEKHPKDEVVFLGSGFETTAVATAAVALASPPKNFSILSVHKYVPAAMNVVAESEETNIEGYIGRTRGDHHRSGSSRRSPRARASPWSSPASSRSTSSRPS